MKKYSFLLINISTVIISSMAYAYLIFGEIGFTVMNRNDFTHQQSTLFDFIMFYLVASLAPTIFVTKLIWNLASNEKINNKVVLRYLGIVFYVFYWVLLIYLFCIFILELDIKEVTNTLFDNMAKLLLFLIAGLTINYSLLYGYTKKAK